jgi:hypothetical protein
MAQNPKPVTHVIKFGKLIRRVIGIHTTETGDLHVEAVALQKPHIWQTAGERKRLGAGTNYSNSLGKGKIPGGRSVTGNAAGRGAEFKLDRASRVT